jgi:hypothetical protein
MASMWRQWLRFQGSSNWLGGDGKLHGTLEPRVSQLELRAAA